MYFINGACLQCCFLSSQGTGNIYNRTYYFDWSKLPEGKYIGQFAFTSSTGSINVSCANIFCDLGFSRTYATATISGSSLSTSTFYIGSALTTPYGVVGNSYLCSALPNNPPFSLSNRPNNNKWRASIRINTKPIHIGYFDTEEEAHQAYLQAKEKYHIIPEAQD